MTVFVEQSLALPGSAQHYSTIQTAVTRAFFWFRVFFVHLLPCIFLVIFNILLCSAMKKAEQRRKRLTNRYYLKDQQVLSRGSRDII